MPSPALDVLGALRLEDGREWGEAATPEQWEDAEAILDPSSPPYSFLTRARGYSKTSDLAGICIAAMLAQLPAGSSLYALASDRDQGRLITDAMAGFVARTPELSGSIGVDSFKATAKNGSTLEVLAADAAGAWGLRPAFVIVDEVCQWATTGKPKQLWEAVTSALAKVDGARMVVLSSAGDPAHFSHRILEHAYSDPLWRVHEIPGPPPWANQARLEEQRRRLPESVYARLFENRWTASEDRLTSLADLRACVTLNGPADYVDGGTYFVGVDLGLKSDRTVCAVVHGERTGPDTVVNLDRMAVWSGTRATPVDLGAVEAWLLEAATKYRARIVGDPWQAVGMFQRLRSQGVQVEEFTFSQQSIGRLATTLHLAIRDHHLALPPDEELIDELANVRLRETSPGVLRMDHDPDKHDDRAIALALGVQAVLGGAGTSAAKDFLESMAAPKQEAADGQHEVGWRWKPIAEPAYAPETAATLAMLRTLNQRSF